MTRVSPHILAAIGNTPRIQIQKVVSKGCARIVAKLESSNPTGSMKDRMAVAMIEEAEAMARRLSSEEGIFAGTSTGANVVAAIRAAKDLGPDATVSTIIIDSGMKYLSTELHGTPKG